MQDIKLDMKDIKFLKNNTIKLGMKDDGISIVMLSSLLRVCVLGLFSQMTSKLKKIYVTNKGF